MYMMGWGCQQGLWLKGHCNGDGAGPGHGRVRAVGAVVTVQDANRGGHCWGSQLWWLRWGEGRKDEVKVNGPPPLLLFIKLVCSRRAFGQFRYNSEICFQPANKNN